MNDRVRPAVPGDASAIAGCVHAAYRHYVYRIGRAPGPMLDDYAAVLSRDDVHVLERDGRIVGVLVLKRRDGGMLLDNIAVHPACQGEGLGDRLLAFAQARVTGMGFTHLELYTHALMHRNIAWYERHAFVVCARVHEHGFDRVYMRKRLAGTEPAA